MKYRIVFDGYDDGERYDSYDEAEEMACEMCSAFKRGKADLYAMNPGDYDLEPCSKDTADYYIEEVDE